MVKCVEKARDTMNRAMIAVTNDTTLPGVGGKLASLVAACTVTVGSVMTGAFASGGSTNPSTTGNVGSSVASGIQGGLNSLWGLLKAVGIPVAAIAVVFAAFQIFTGGEKGMEKAKKTLLYTAVGVGILYLGPWLITTIAGWFTSAGDGGAFTWS